MREYASGRTSSTIASRLVPLKNLRPAFLCAFHSSPEELIIPWPNRHEHSTTHAGQPYQINLENDPSQMHLLRRNFRS